MRKEITIQPEGGPISVNVKIEGLIVAGYHLQVFEAKSNNVIVSFSGNNEYDDDDMRVLPNTAKMNVGRVIMLDVVLANIDDVVENRRYTIALEVYQNDTLIDAAIKEDALTKNSQDVLILVKLNEL